MPRNTNGSGSNPRIGPKLQEAIAALVDGRARTQTVAAKLAGMSAPQLSRALKKPHVQRHLLQEATRHLRGLPAVLAAARLAKLIDAKSDDVAARVSMSLAENAGLIDGRRLGGARAGADLGSGPVLQVIFRHIQPVVGAPAQIPTEPRPVIEIGAPRAPATEQREDESHV